MMLKKLALGAGITLVALNLTGCFGGNKYAKYKDAEWNAPEKAFYIANELVGNVFNDKREDVADELEDNTDFKYVRKNNDGSITLSRYKETLFYVGETDDNQPDGIGGLYEEDYLTKKLYPIYIGEWEDGKYNGYGQLYDVAYGYMSKKVLTYEGYFEDNKPNGEGIDYYIRENTNVDKGTFILTYAEDFNERLKVDGKVKKFIDGVLIFEADTDRDSDYAKGKEYYKNGELKYKGEFKNGRYHGDGVLYDENGKEIYDGEFERGNYK